jgi:hypothetical protein
LSSGTVAIGALKATTASLPTIQKYALCTAGGSEIRTPGCSVTVAVLSRALFWIRIWRGRLSNGARSSSRLSRRRAIQRVSRQTMRSSISGLNSEAGRIAVSLRNGENGGHGSCSLSTVKPKLWIESWGEPTRQPPSQSGGRGGVCVHTTSLQRSWGSAATAVSKAASAAVAGCTW